MNVRTALPVTPGRRISSDSVWPLRRADGRPWHAATPKEKQESRNAASR